METSYWLADPLDFIDLNKGDEIEIEDHWWLVSSIDKVMGGGRQGDTIMYLKVTLLTFEDNEPLEESFKIYAKWYVKDLARKPSLFEYKILKKEAWELVWKRKVDEPTE